ncbi:hypothetical protein TIFTF001_022423 [Ficus carica]|uniref:Uncharacterized protein n=1 Tax=Ficus carica TaxID=3494 RepID=A0AA88AIM2_FICCA|nr:hypothetical protein TIFTF001_022423 [Ficus carica]
MNNIISKEGMGHYSHTVPKEETSRSRSRPRGEFLGDIEVRCYGDELLNKSVDPPQFSLSFALTKATTTRTMSLLVTATEKASNNSLVSGREGLRGEREKQGYFYFLSRYLS